MFLKYIINLYMEREHLFIQINSGDFSVGPLDSYTNFTNQIQKIDLDKSIDYEVCLYDLMYRNDQVIDPFQFPMKNVNVNCDLVNATIVGSTSSQLVFQVNWQDIVNNSIPAYTSGVDSACYLTSFNKRQWFPLVKKNISSVKLFLTFPDGSLIKPGLGSGFTSATFAIREVV